MHNSTSAPQPGRTPERWHRIEALPQLEAEELARTARITRAALRGYMGAHLVAEATEDAPRVTTVIAWPPHSRSKAVADLVRTATRLQQARQH